jgi:hypothetical protein
MRDAHGRRAKEAGEGLAHRRRHEEPHSRDSGADSQERLK